MIESEGFDAGLFDGLFDVRPTYDTHSICADTDSVRPCVRTAETGGPTTMKSKPTKNQASGAVPLWKQLGASLIILGSFSACSSVPDYANPVEWYRSAADAFSGDANDANDTEDTEAAEPKRAIPGEDDEFPTLDSVPDRPASVDDSGAVADGLIADPNASPDYAPAIALQPDDSRENGTGASGATGGAALQPVPPAQPTVAVETEAMKMPEGIPEQAPDADINGAAPAAPDIPSGSYSGTTGTAATPPVSGADSGMIVSQPLVVEPGKLPSGETYEQYRARLMAGLKQIGTPSPTTILTGRGNTWRTGPSDTVVISSNGVQSNNRFNRAVFASAPSGMTDARGLREPVNESGFLQVDGSTGQPYVIPGSVRIATIHFDNGASGLDQTDLRVLQKVAALQQQRGGVIRVIGHASSRTRTMDPVNHKMVNYNVSMARAERVARELVRLGTTKDRIIIGAVSDREPLYHEVMPSGEAGNRRAEIFIDS